MYTFRPIFEYFLHFFYSKNTGNTVAEIPVFGIDFNTGIPVLGIGIGSLNLGYNSLRDQVLLPLDPGHQGKG